MGNYGDTNTIQDFEIQVSQIWRTLESDQVQIPVHIISIIHKWNNNNMLRYLSQEDKFVTRILTAVILVQNSNPK